VPPLFKFEYIISEIDRHTLLLASFPLQFFLTQSFILGMGRGDAWDLFWYNSSESAGSQVYPSGLSKYFDLYSYPGFMNYLFYWTWIWFTTLVSPFTLFIPLNIWLAILNGMSWEGIWKVLIPLPISWFFGVTGENGWILG